MIGWQGQLCCGMILTSTNIWLQVEELRATNDQQMVAIEDYEAQRQVRSAAAADGIHCVHALPGNSHLHAATTLVLVLMKQGAPR
jgi:hypothetical protein